MPRSKSSLAPRCAAMALLLAATWARAETNPYYLGVSANLMHDSNLYRLPGDGALPAGVSSRADTVLTNSLVAGVDQTWGRQRLNGSAALRNNHYFSNSALNYNGYSLNLGLDWATVNRISGTVTVGADRSLRRFDATVGGQVTTVQNVETDQHLSSVVRIGVVTRLTAQAGYQYDSADFSANAYGAYRYHRNTLSANLQYTLGGALTMAAGLRRGHTTFALGSSDGYDRNDLDLTANWAPSGLSTAYARLSHSSLQYDRLSSYDSSGITWELRGSTQLSGKVRVNASLWHDYGLSNSNYLQTVDIAGQTIPIAGVTQFNHNSTNLRLGADYAATGKVVANAGFTVSRRDLSTSLVTFLGPVPGGGDTTQTLALGASWQATRAAQLSCNVSREQRSASGQVSYGYGSNSFGCAAQFILQ